MAAPLLGMKAAAPGAASAAVAKTHTCRTRHPRLHRIFPPATRAATRVVELAVAALPVSKAPPAGPVAMRVAAARAAPALTMKAAKSEAASIPPQGPYEA